MKKLFVAITFLLFVNLVKAQMPVSISGGYSYYSNGNGGILQMQINFGNNFSIGPEVNYAQLDYGILPAFDTAGNIFHYNQTGQKICGGLRFQLHPFTYYSAKTDPYIAVTGGYAQENYSYDLIPPGIVAVSKFNRFFGAINIGLNYYFNDNIAAFAEAGAGTGLIKVGLTVKIY